MRALVESVPLVCTFASSNFADISSGLMVKDFCHFEMDEFEKKIGL